MAKYLRVDPGFDPDSGMLTGINYRLGADTDLRTLAQGIRQSMAEGSSVEIQVELEDDPRGSAIIVLNSARVTSVLLGETPEPDE
jgi:hypothetical protein